ncbi:hypothetical protein [Rhodococcus jostii]|uniref:hypothetical protein n=1 Tax=Rhodococcus jostii TaxID=132919 RepID=UPI00362792BC
MSRIKVEIDNTDGTLSVGGQALAQAVVEMLSECTDDTEYVYRAPKQVALNRASGIYVNNLSDALAAVGDLTAMIPGVPPVDGATKVRKAQSSLSHVGRV